MTRSVLLFGVFFFTLSFMHGQTMRKSEARRILNTAYTCLKTSDSVRFVGLWHFDDQPLPFSSNKQFRQKNALLYFPYLREFLDTAIMKDLKIDHIEITPTSAENKTSDFGDYNIRAWFKYREGYYEGFGFFVEYIDNKWKVRFTPDTMTHH